MGLRERLLQARAAHHLTAAMLELTYACELRCQFCYNDRSKRGTRLSIDEYRALLDELAELGCLFLTLTGGEPTRHPRFLDIGAHAKARGFVVRVKSHAVHLQGDTLDELIARVDPDRIETSLHGATADVHEAQTQVPGSFAAVLESIRQMRALGLRVHVNSTLTTLNAHQIDDMFALTDALDVPLFVDAEVTPRDDGDQSPLAMTAPRSGVRRLREIQRERRPAASELLEVVDSPYHCGAGVSTLHIDPFGDVFPCVQWRRPIGNARVGLASLWSSSNMDEVRRDNRLSAAHVTRRGLTSLCPGNAARRGALPIL